VLSKHFDGPLFATAGTAHSRSGLASRPFSQVKANDEFDVAGMRVHTFPTSHDVSDPMCFRFEVREQGKVADAIAWATDTGYLTQPALQALRGCRVLGIEANHDPHMLATGPYPPFLKARVGGNSGHLSNVQAAEALPQLLTDETETVVGMHISEKNNLPELAAEALRQAVQDRAEVLLGSQAEPLVIW
jgi:phosphoribosyl 1,2-cyclic phosphodiesterase